MRLSPYWTCLLFSVQLSVSGTTLFSILSIEFLCTSLYTSARKFYCFYEIFCEYFIKTFVRQHCPLNVQVRLLYWNP